MEKTTVSPLEDFFEALIVKGKYRIVRNGNSSSIFPRENQEYYKPEIVIKDVRRAEELLREYVLLIDKLDIRYTNKNSYHDSSYYLSMLVFNMTSSDAACLEDYIVKRISMLSDETFSDYDENRELFSFDNVIFSAQRVCEDPGLETPYVIEFSVNINGVTHLLPMVRYAIDENGTCHLFAIQKGRYRNCDFSNLDYVKVVNRVNTGFNSGRDVCPSFVLALSLFIRMLKEKGISKIVVPDILFCRYRNYYRARTECRSDDILSRLLEKFILLLQRFEERTDGFNIVYYPNEIDSYTHIELCFDELDSKNLLLSTSLK